MGLGGFVALDELKARIEEKHHLIGSIKTEIGKVIVGQHDLTEGLLIGLFTKGHILIEGVPGLAKTSAVKALAETVRADFKRIQFTPDLLPADLIGTEIYRPKTGDFYVKKGPIFHNIILADEINRAPSKVQSALLEAMQERQGHHRRHHVSAVGPVSGDAPRRTLSSRREPTRCPRPRSTGL